MINTKNVETTLKNINWSFFPKPTVSKEALQPFNCRRYHWYPATFIPEIPYTLIELLSKPGDKIFDPFLGIGTTYFQALILNRIPFGVDINKVSIELVYAIKKLLDPSTDLIELRYQILDYIDRYDPHKKYSNYLNTNDNKFLNELEKWYSQSNFNMICFFRYLEDFISTETIQNVIRVISSSLLQTVSNQDRGWGCIADNMIPKNFQKRNAHAIKSFKQSLKKLFDDIEITRCKIEYENCDVFNYLKDNDTVWQADIKDKKSIYEKIPKNSIDLIVTSPPYPNMVDYTTSQRLSYYYMSRDIINDKDLEIGARCRRRRTDALSTYKQQMEAANTTITNLLKPGGIMCYILPSFNSNNKNNEERKNIVYRIVTELEMMGLQKKIELCRDIPNLRRSHNKKWASLGKEAIYIFQKV